MIHLTLKFILCSYRSVVLGTPEVPDTFSGSRDHVIFFLILLPLLLSHLSCVRLCVTPWTAAYQAPPSSHGIFQVRVVEWVAISFSMHESEKWKWSRSVVSDPQRPHGLQPTRLLRPWDFPGKSTGVGCHCLLHLSILLRLYLPFSFSCFLEYIVEFSRGCKTCNVICALGANGICAYIFLCFTNFLVLILTKRLFGVLNNFQ